MSASLLHTEVHMLTLHAFALEYMETLYFLISTLIANIIMHDNNFRPVAVEVISLINCKVLCTSVELGMWDVCYQSPFTFCILHFVGSMSTNQPQCMNLNREKHKKANI